MSATCWSVIFCTSSSAAPLVVFRNLVVLEQLLQPLVGVAADLAHGVAASSAYLWTSRDISFRRSSVSDGIGMRIDLAVRRRIQAEVRLLDAPLDGAHQRRVERLRDDQRRLRDGQRRHLVERHRSCRRPRRAPDRAADTEARPVRRPPSSWRTCSMALSIRFLTSAFRPLRSLTSMRLPRQFGVCRDRRAHGFAHDDAPEVAGLRAGLNTTIGSLLSMQSEIAVASMTFSRCSSTSR